MTAAADVRALLTQLDQAREKATPGPWAQPVIDTYGNELRDHKVAYIPGVVEEETGGHDVSPSAPLHPADAALIVAMHGALPGLIAAVRQVLNLADASDDGTEYEHDHGPQDGHPECPACWAAGIRSAVAAALTTDTTP